MKGTYRLLKTLGAFCCGLSEEKAVKAGNALGKFFWLLVPARRKRLAVANLLRTGLAKDKKEAERIAKASAVRFGPLGVSMFRFPLLTKENISEYVTIRGKEKLDAIKAEGKGCILAATHCGNWELLGGLFFYNFKDCECPIKPGVLHVVYKALKNKTWDKVFYENRRCPTPDTEGQIEASGMLRFIAGHRREKYIYLVNNDQFPRESSCEVGTFLNQPTTGFVGAATLASRLKLSVLYMGMVNDRRGHYSIRFERICDDASLMTPEEITRRYYDLLEKDIKETPHNWLWSHKRWKNIK